MLDHSRVRRRRQRAGAEHEHRLLPIGPRVKGQDRLVRLAANDQCIDRGHELFVAVGFTAAWREKIQTAITSGDEAIEAGTDEHGSFHEGAPVAVYPAKCQAPAVPLRTQPRLRTYRDPPCTFVTECNDTSGRNSLIRLV